MAVNINIPSQVSQSITDGVTTTAPSENAVFDALALKANSADLALVATSGDYNDLSNLPSIPAAQVNSDWNAISGVAEILNKPTIPTSLPPSGSAGGDLSGTYPNPNVTKVHGIDLQNGTPTANDTWVYGGSPAKWQHQHLNASQVDNDSSVTGTNVKLALEHLDSSKQASLVSGTNIKTINGTTLLGSGDITVGGGITVGTTAVTSGTTGRVFFQGTGNVVQQDSALFYDNTNKRLGLGANGNTPTSTLFVRTNTTTAHDTFILQNGQYGNPIFRVRDNATASQTTIGSLFIAARIYGSNSTTTGNELDLGGYGLGSSYGAATTNAVWLNNQGNVGDGAGNSIISVTSNIFFNLQTTKKVKFEGQSGHFGIGQVGTLGARLDVKAQGALSTDLAFRVRNSVDTSNLFVVKGNGVLNAANMPTSAAGLVTGDIWSNLGILTIV